MAWPGRRGRPPFEDVVVRVPDRAVGPVPVRAAFGGERPPSPPPVALLEPSAAGRDRKWERRGDSRASDDGSIWRLAARFEGAVPRHLGAIGVQFVDATGRLECDALSEEELVLHVDQRLA